MTLRDFTFTIIGGLIVWLAQQAYLNRRETRKEQALRVIKAPNSEKVITDDIFQHLKPGNSIELMRDMLGVPNRLGRKDTPVFSEEEIETNSYLYLLKNAHVKITSKDNESIDSLTVMLVENDTLSISNLLIWEEEDEDTGPDEFLITAAMLEGRGGQHTYIQTRWDESFAIDYYVGAPLYLHYTFFGSGLEKYEEYEKAKDPKAFIGCAVAGICVSYSPDDSYYIYDAELR